jgi:hypothetical protein
LGEGSHLVENLSLNAHGAGERAPCVLALTQNQETGLSACCQASTYELRLQQWLCHPLRSSLIFMMTMTALTSNEASMINNYTVEKMMKPKSKYFELRFGEKTMPK